jgi:hypothetical protein
MKWCCLTFKSWYEAAGERGFTILVGRNTQGKPQFVLQHRAVDKEVEDSINTEYPLSLVSDIYISYCPWCGRNLGKWYGNSVDALFRSGFKVSIAGLDSWE